MKRTIILVLLLAACRGKQPAIVIQDTIPMVQVPDLQHVPIGKKMQSHAHRQLGYYEPLHAQWDGKQLVRLFYRCEVTERDTIVETSVDSIRYYVHFMRSEMPMGYDSVHYK